MGRIPEAMTLTASAPGSSSGREPGTPPLTMTVKELAAALRIGRRAAYEAITRGDVPGVVRIGRSIRISRAAVEAWLSADIGQRVEEKRLEGGT